MLVKCEDFELVASRFNVLVPLRSERAILYNTLNQSLMVLDPEGLEIYEQMKAGRLHATNEGSWDFIDAGFAISKDLDEIEKAERIFQEVRSDDSRLLITIAPTLGCNFACDYCFQGNVKPHGRMDESIRQRVIDFIFDQHPNIEYLEVCWYGGEPLNDRTAIYALSRELNQRCAERGIAYSSYMISNGYQLTLEVAQELEKANVEWIQITLDGPARIHNTRRVLLSGKGTSSKIYDNIAATVRETDIKIVIRCNVDERNIDLGFELIDELAAKGFPGDQVSIYFAPIQAMTSACASSADIVEGKKAFARREIALMKYAVEKGVANWSLPGVFQSVCVGVQKNGWVVTPDGDLHKCFDTVQRTDLSVGKLLEGAPSLESNKLGKWTGWSPFRNKTCRDCTLLPSCAGACAYKFIHHSEVHGDDSRLPCPSLKFNIAERLFHACVASGAVRADEWLPILSATKKDQMGDSYSNETFVAQLETLAQLDNKDAN